MSDDGATIGGEDGQCETEKCPRQASKIIRYNVYVDGGLRQYKRKTCTPCINAMRFRETFAQGGEAWQTQPIEESDCNV